MRVSEYAYRHAGIDQRAVQIDPASFRSSQRKAFPGVIQVDDYVRFTLPMHASIHGRNGADDYRELCGKCREQLLDAVWGKDVYVEARTVDVHIRRLRKAINRPRQSDPNYVFLEDGITDAEFTAALAFWKTVSASAEKFDDAADYLAFILSPRLKQRFAAFRTSALAPAGAPRLAAVFRSGLMDLDLGFSSTEGDAANFFVSVSRSQSGFQMTNFQTQY